MKDIKRISIRLAVLIATIAISASCIKDEILHISPDNVETEIIAFGISADWGDAKDVVTKSDVAGSNRLGNRTLTTEDGSVSLPLGVYVQNGIHCTSADAPQTKGVVVSSKDGISSFNVWSTLTKTDNTTINYFSDIQYTKNPSDGVFYPAEEDEYYWPGAGTLDFVAVSNMPASGFTVNMTDNAVTSFDYTVPTDATKQPDIMLAKAADIDGNNNVSVPLEFRHIMSAVNIQIGKVVAGEIRSIKLTNVYNKGTYNVTANKWNVDPSSKSDYNVVFANGDKFTSTGSEAEGASVNAANATFLFIPQEPGEGAEMVIEFYDSNTGRLYSDAAGAYAPALRGSIAGDIWDMAKTTNYKLSIDESFTLTIEPTGKKLDAHYIISEVNVTVDGIANWQITAKANDNAQVSILPYDEANPLAQQGFWTDVEVNESGVETTTSARGSSSYSGSGNLTNEKFLLFIPENISDTDRSISIILSSTDESKPAETTKVLLQKFPNWTGDIGWEVVDDDEAGKYGFKWDRKVAYTLKYSYHGWTGIGGNYSKSEMEEFLTGLVNQYGASSYASVVDFRYNGLANRRMYIYIEYDKLNNLSGASSTTDGFNNTKALYSVGGAATSMAFETVLSTTLKSKGDTSDPLAFHKVVSTDAYHTDYGVPAEEGSLNDLSGILTYIQKKNRYCLQIIDDAETKAYHPVFNINDLKWFLPAHGQFKDVDFTPENSSDSAEDYWSSTAADGSEYAYRGSGSRESRDTQLAVIAARVNENNYGTATATVDNTSLAGGENGDTNQWL